MNEIRNSIWIHTSIVRKSIKMGKYLFIHNLYIIDIMDNPHAK
jgi:hydrogenase maturation factor